MEFRELREFRGFRELREFRQFVVSLRPPPPEVSDHRDSNGAPQPCSVDGSVPLDAEGREGLFGRALLWAPWFRS